MKAKSFFLFLLLPLLNLSASPLQKYKNVHELTFSRDNSYCSFNSVNFEIQIRANERYAQPDDRHYGEFIFIVQKGVHHKIDLDYEIGRFRFLSSKENICTKSLAIPFSKDEVTLFFTRDNRPLPDLLTLIHYNPKSLSSKVTKTEYLISDFVREGDEVIFLSYHPTTKVDKILYEQLPYSQLTSTLPIWKRYKSGKVKTDLKETFKRFPWKYFFKDLNEFKEQYQWDIKRGEFNTILTELIINYNLKKRCIKIGQDWRCLSF